MVQRVGRDQKADLAERAQFSTQTLGEGDRRPDEQAAADQADDGHARRVAEAAAGGDDRSIGKPDLGTEPLQDHVDNRRQCFTHV